MTKLHSQSLALQRQIIKQLADGQLYSGEELAQQAGISRAAIAKHIQALQQLGLDIYAVKGKGYRLAAPLHLLDIQLMKQQQPALTAEIILQHVTDSTNTQLLRKIQDGIPIQKGSVVVAEAQTNGRGRRGNEWFSPFGANLYFSMYWQLEQGIQAAMGLSLVVGLAVVELLEEHYHLDVKLKWPNDIYLQNEKLGGILVELAGQSHAQCDIVIGLGLNVQMPETAQQQIQQRWTDLHQHMSMPIDRNTLVVQLQQYLQQYLLRFEQCGFSVFVDEYNLKDQFSNQSVKLTSSNQQFIGVCQGVDAQGGIILAHQGQLQTYYGGELSLRGVE